METTIKVENVTGGTGNHALWVGAKSDQADKDHAGFFFLKAAPPLRVYALQGSSTIVAWVHNRQFNIMDVEDPENPPAGLPVTGAMIYLENLTPNSDWKAEWWHTNPCTAWETYQNLHVGSDGKLSLVQDGDNRNMPSSITWDAALILTKTSP